MVSQVGQRDRVDVLLKRGAKLLRKHPVRRLALIFEPGDMDRIGDVANCAVLANRSSGRFASAL